MIEATGGTALLMICSPCVRRGIVRWGAAAILTGVALATAPAALAVNTREVEPSVVRVFALVTGSDSMMTGTGWLISGKRVVVTNNHVVEGGSGGYRLGYLDGGAVRIVEAKLVRRSPEKDLAILEAAADLPGHPLDVAGYELEPASKVVAVGFPGTADATVVTDKATGEAVRVGFAVDDPNFYRPTWTEGIVSRQLTRFPGQDVRVVQHSAAINHGNSGGPLFDPCGRVAGVNTFGAVLDEPQGVFYSIHPSEIVKFLEAASFRPSVSSRPCLLDETTSPGLLAALAATLGLSAAALALAYRRKVEVVMRPVSAVVDRLSRVLPRSEAAQRLRAARWATGAGAGASVIRLEPVKGGAAVVIDLRHVAGGRGLVLGRSSTCDVMIEDASVSRRHARLTAAADGTPKIEDLGSTGGLWRNGQRVGEAALRQGDLVRLGSAEYRVAISGPT